MVDQYTTPPEDMATQLVQVRIPLDKAADVFGSADANGRVPIVVVPERPLRVRTDLLLLAGGLLIGAVLIGSFVNPLSLLVPTFVVAAIIVTGASLLPAFRVRVPEGTNALVAVRGRYWKTLESGLHGLPPWVAVTHLVTRRQVPYDSPAIEVPTSDFVRATIDALMTFQITDPYRFVYSISASDFDLVLKAAFEDAVRQMVGQIGSDTIMTLGGKVIVGLREAIDTEIAIYGVTISKVHITYVRPPADFINTQEERQLAVVKRAERVQQQELALRRQADDEELLLRQTVAVADRRREELRHQIDQALLRRQLIDLEAENEALRLAKLEERLRQFPNAARYDWDRLQLEVARALAGNTRAVLQVGDAGDIGRVLMISDLHKDPSNGAAPSPPATPEATS